jgi:N,N'-diacetyllegionaminate synthase
MNEIKIKGKKIGNNNPVFIVAEMACSHDGSMEIAKKIIEAAFKAGADAINFQMTDLANYMVENYSAGGVSQGKGKGDIYKYLEKIFWFKEKEWQELFNYAKKKNLIISATINDLKSGEIAHKLNADIYQIHSSSLGEKNLVKQVARFKKPVCLKIGGTFLGEIEKAVGLIINEGNYKTMLQHGFQSYPTKIEEVNLRFITALKKMFDLPVGYGDHTDGSDPLALVIPLLSIPFGVSFLEKHLTHNRAAKCEDFESALNPDDFKRFVAYVRMAEKGLGQEQCHIFSQDEKQYRNISKKRAVAGADIRAGERITENKIVFKRANQGIFPEEADYLLKRIAKQDIKKDEPITWDKIQ